ncbi:MAG TPA: HlyD family efflux transporter periplasmic adaptor subunit, partial [Polyangiaceae bacterium]|nr:HlyD family efflux transporter periplasmic adaptor subunit [Polyangiaceae bacterium]
MLVLCGAAALAGCHEVSAEIGDRYQGIIELDERLLGFELPGRVSTVGTVRGAAVRAGEQLAALDPELAVTARAARASDADAAEAQLALVKAGSRGEEIRSMQAQLRAARASEDLLGKNLERERALRARNASTDAAVEDLEGRLEQAVGERQSVEQRLAQLLRGSRSEERAAAEARAGAARAAVRLEDERIARHVLTSPADGAVLDVHVKSGEFVAAGSPVVTLGDTKHPFADVFVPEGKLSGLRIGARGEVRVDGEPAPFGGVIETV